MAHNRLERLPKVAVKNPAIRSIDASYNQLTAPPERIEILTRLVRLDLSHNLLAGLPAEVGLLRFLKWFNVSHNQLEQLPNEICCLEFCLNEFYASNNHLRALPNDFGRFQAFRMSGFVFKSDQRNFLRLSHVFGIQVKLIYPTISSRTLLK